MKQFILPESWTGSGSLILGEEDSHYFLRVKRLNKGDCFTAMDKEGRRYNAEILDCDELCTLALTPLEEARERGPEIVLWQCIPKGKKIDLIIRQAVEAGVSKVIPIISDHAVPSFKTVAEKEKKRERWNKIATEAAQQSGTSFLTEIGPLLTMDEALDQWNTQGPGLFCHQIPLKETSLHRVLEESHETISLVIGPEGGISDRETEILQKKGFQPVYLGDNILRAETAATFALGAIKIILLEKKYWKK